MVPNSPSKSLDFDNSGSTDKVERQNISIEKLDISQDNKNQNKTNSIKYENLPNQY